MSLQQFFLAALRSDNQQLAELCEQYAGQRDSLGRTAMMLCAMKGNFDGVQIMREFEEGCVDSRGMTALMYSAGIGFVKAVRVLSKGVELGQKTRAGLTAAMIAASQGCFECLKHLKGEFGVQNRHGQTALMLASVQNQVECIQMLKEAEFYCKDARGMNALMHACLAGQLEAVQALLTNEDMTDVDTEHPYSFGEKSLDNKTALRYAFDAMERTKTLEEQQAKALAETAYNIASAIFEEEKDSITGEENATTLMLSAGAGADEFVEKLSAQANQQDNNGLTALMYAARAGHVSCVSILLEKEAKRQDKLGKTALMHAVQAGEVECVQALLKDELEIRNEMGDSVLHVAASCGEIEIVSAVKKVFLGEKNKEGEPALFKAIRHMQLPCARILQEEASVVTESGKTALMEAAEAGIEEFIEAWGTKQRGKRDKNGWGAACWAAYGDSVSVLPKLINLCGTGGFPVIFAAVKGDSKQVLKFITDVAREGRSEMFKVPRAPKELCKFCRSQVEYRAQKLPGITNGDNALQYGVKLGKSAAIRILAPFLRQPELYSNNFTPLMLGVTQQYQHVKPSKEAIQALCKHFAARQTLKDLAGTRAGTTALMLGALTVTDNLNWLIQLIPYEKDLRDADGRDALDYARAADRQEAIALLRGRE